MGGTLAFWLLFGFWECDLLATALGKGRWRGSKDHGNGVCLSSGFLLSTDTCLGGSFFFVPGMMVFGVMIPRERNTE